MEITLQNLKQGISYWIEKKGFPRDFHSNFYSELYNIQSEGLNLIWWNKIVEYLWDWRAIRSRTPPNTKDTIRLRGVERIDKLQAHYTRLSQQSEDPSFFDFGWEDINDFYREMADIKQSSTPVFPSKLGHFIFPKMFIVLDQDLTGVKNYPDFWASLKDIWNSFADKENAVNLLKSKILHSGSTISEKYPFEIKIIELSYIGKKHRG